MRKSETAVPASRIVRYVPDPVAFPVVLGVLLTSRDADTSDS